MLDDPLEVSSFIIVFRLWVFPRLGTDLERSLGIGKAEAAGEAWNVGPAYACVGGLFSFIGVDSDASS